VTKLKKIIFLVLKSVITITLILVLVLFFYAALFYDKKNINEDETKKIEENSTLEEKNLLNKEELETKKLKESLEQKKINQSKTKKIQQKIPIKDGLYATVGSKAITKSDIVNEIKMLIILNNKTFSEEESKKLHEIAIKAAIRRNIKLNEIEKHDLSYNQQDLKNEISRLANKVKMDIKTLQNVFESNDIDFSILQNNIKTELLWNSLIFQLYKNRISIDLEEIEEQLKLIQNKKEIEEYLISEIVIERVETNELKTKINTLMKKINEEGFDKVALNLSISDSAPRGGDLGWISENMISKKLKTVISSTETGKITKPILLPDGVLIFKVRNKRMVKKNINLEEVKNQLVNTEKTKILNMHSASHLKNLRRSISIKFFQ